MNVICRTLTVSTFMSRSYTSAAFPKYSRNFILRLPYIIKYSSFHSRSAGWYFQYILRYFVVLFWFRLSQCDNTIRLRSQSRGRKCVVCRHSSCEYCICAWWRLSIKYKYVTVWYTVSRPEKSYRLWRVVVCDQETSKTRRLKPATGLWKIHSQWVVMPGKQTNNKHDIL